jgi:hypothetical protein
MPIEYSVDLDRKLIFEVWTGEVTAKVLGTYWRAYLADPEVMAIRRTLVDLRQCEIIFTGSELSELVDDLVSPILAGRHWRTALVVGRPAQFGVSRQYQVFAQHYSQDAIFHEPEAALKWLLTEAAK